MEMSRLSKLRVEMEKRGIDIYVIPSEDAHGSEFIAPCDARREFMTQLSCSSGCAVVTRTLAVLFTDGRYAHRCQANRYLDNDWEVINSENLTWQEWTVSRSGGPACVAVDPLLLLAQDATQLDGMIRDAGGMGLRAVETNLVDQVWGSRRPDPPMQPIQVFPGHLAGQSISAKLAQLRRIVSCKGALGLVVTDLDEIAWLFNLRGSDVPFNPVFFAYAVLTSESATLFVDHNKLDITALAYLRENKIALRPYGFFLEHLRNLATVQSQIKKTVLVPVKAPWAVYTALGGAGCVELLESPIGQAQAIRTPLELKELRHCHLRDSVALCEYFAWLEAKVHQRAEVDEAQAAKKLELYRSKQSHFVGLSYPTISAAGPNAADIHYIPDPSNCSAVTSNNVYLCDSGAHYWDGTTDVTRTFHFGKPTAQQRTMNTLVLKAHIAVAKAKLASDTKGADIDDLARGVMKKAGKDYPHSTWHGIGQCLGVHASYPRQMDRLVEGHVLTNEPGYYKQNEFGIRIENAMAIRRAGQRATLAFEQLTMVPYGLNLIDATILTPQEKEWINKYHKKVKQSMEPLLAGDALTMDWLRRETSAL